MVGLALGQAPALGTGLSVAKNMGAQHIDLSARVTKEGTDPSHHLGVGTLPHPAGLVMKLKGHDQKQMLCVDGDMRFPHVLEVVVVGCRSAALHLGNDSSPWPKWEEEVWPSTCHEAILRAQDQLRSEPEATFEKLAYGPLDCAALGTMNMKGCDEVDAAVQVLNESRASPLTRCTSARSLAESRERTSVAYSATGAAWQPKNDEASQPSHDLP